MSGEGKDTLIWSVAEGRIIQRLPTLSGVKTISFSPDGTRLVTGHFNGVMGHWYTSTGVAVEPPLQHRLSTVVEVQYAPSGDRILAASSDGNVVLWDLASLSSTPRIMEPLPAVSSAAFTPDGRYVLVGCVNGSLQLMDALTGLNVYSPVSHRGSVLAVCMNESGDRILTVAADGTAYWQKLYRAPVAGTGLLPEIAELVSGFELNGEGNLVRKWNQAALLDAFLNKQPDTAIELDIWRHIAPKQLRRQRGEE